MRISGSDAIIVLDKEIWYCIDSLTNRNLCVEVMVVKKKVTIAFVITGILAISTMIIFSTYKSSEAYRKAKAKT